MSVEIKPIKCGSEAWQDIDRLQTEILPTVMYALMLKDVLVDFVNVDGKTSWLIQDMIREYGLRNPEALGYLVEVGKLGLFSCYNARPYLDIDR